MTDFDDVVKLLDKAVGTRQVGTHGAFWRTMTRDEFVAGQAVGESILIVGDSAGSNLIKALRGLIPFGADAGTPGAAYRRMPAGLPAMSEADIRTIEGWIDAGCPAGAGAGKRPVSRPSVKPTPAAVSKPPTRVTVAARGGGPISEDAHVAFWRELDDWALFNRTPAVSDALGPVMQAGREWVRKVAAGKDTTRVHAGVDNKMKVLAAAQKYSFARHFGNPIQLRTMMISFEKFGADEFPRDSKRPKDPVHNMNAAMMWFQWAAFCEGCIHAKRDPELWYGVLRAVIVGAVSDGLVRRRITVAKSHSRSKIKEFAQTLPEADVMPTMREIVRDSGIV